ncbi:hypothetical protein BD410DRAFT_899810 [Rickenella mellea]|uniref:Zinc finger PHD-type domain-containing protein n=1 Tax=Rickenella mellea TaxID=50990 RepID=A0A4Y7PYD3_9AGAM|nr:hypothetical protein BD410DRAFT_899810 [Rickenella mellea]
MAKSKKKHNVDLNAPVFDENSKRRCDPCNVDVLIGTGGESNWNGHLKSKVHRRNAGAISNTRELSNYFTAAQIPKPPKVPSPAPVLSTSRIPNNPVENDHPDIIDLVDCEEYVTEHSETQTRTSLPTLSERLRSLAASLPASVPVGTRDDVLALFSGNPRELASGCTGDDAWEAIDPVLNRVIGFGKTSPELVPIIRRGPLGIDGLCSWLEICINELGINSALLEGKTERLESALKLLKCLISADRPRITRLRELQPTSGALHQLMWIQLWDHVLDTLLLFPTATVHSLHTPLHCMNLERSRGLFMCMRNHSRFDRQPARDLHVLRKAMKENLASHTVTRYDFLSIGHLRGLLDRKNVIIENLRLTALNTGRSLTTRNRHIEGWKRLVLAIGSSDIPRIQSLLRTAENNATGVFGLLQKVDQAARRVYMPLSYQERDFERLYLVWKLGGASAANVAHRTLGLPSIDATRRHVVVQPLRSSPGVPTVEELRKNLAICFPPSATTPARSQVIYGATMMMDEINLQERLRWDPVTDDIIGMCRECTPRHCVTKFKSIKEADSILECIRDGKVHLATEATVIAVSILTENPHEYNARPFVISGTCKREDVLSHAKLLSTASDELSSSLAQVNVRVYSWASDGDARRRRAMAIHTMSHELPESDPIFQLLSPLRLFNTRCGKNGLTCDMDTKHGWKRFRNKLSSNKGCIVNDIAVTVPVLKKHLMVCGMSDLTASLLLCPNDKQDVVLTIRLLNAISNLPVALSSDSPSTTAARRILRLLGRLYRHLLDAYLDVSCSLHDQLRHLSAAAHLVLALYAQNKGNFISVQLYYDTMTMIKNVYFCIAKTIIDNPDGSFWIILLGTDALEHTFGKVRTMVGNDVNVDQFQLGNRIHTAVECQKILHEHPDWLPTSRRLQVQRLDQHDDDISKKYDHISPKSWRGDVKVKGLSLQGCWLEGRRDAESELRDALITPPFEGMDSGDGFDIFSPFGNGRIVLIDGDIAPEEAHETAEEQDISWPAETSGNGGDTASNQLETPTIPCFQPDLEDRAAVEDAVSKNVKHEAYIVVDASGILKHKATIARVISAPITVAESKDRLKRIREYSQYDERQRQSPDLIGFSAEDDTGGVAVGDPVVTLVRCEKKMFLAIVQVVDIQLSNNSVGSLPFRLIHEPNVTFRTQIMRLTLKDTSHQPEGADWEWTGKLEASNQFGAKHLAGKWIELINPEIQLRQNGIDLTKPTYCFKTSDLRSFAAVLYERLRDEDHLPVVEQSEEFPYRSASGHFDSITSITIVLTFSISGKACFVCETEGVAHKDASDNCCKLCPNVRLSDLSGPKRIEHMAAHILHDERLRDAKNPCSLCLSTGDTCAIFLIESKKRTSVNERTSRCPNLYKIRLSSAGRSTQSGKSTCSNIPIRCNLCLQPRSPAVWKYNLRQHILDAHPGADVNNYTHQFTLEEREITFMKSVFLKKPRRSRKKDNALKTVSISAAHSSRLSIRSEGLIPSTSQEVEPSDGQPHPTSSDNEDSSTSSSESEADEDMDMDSSDDSETDGDTDMDIEMDADTNAVFLAANEDRATSNTAERHDVPTSTARRPTRASAKRKYPSDGVFSDSTCGDPSCGRIVDSDPLICKGPGCGQQFHLACKGMFEQPTTDWFCDDDCRGNALGRTTRTRKRPRVAK